MNTFLGIIFEKKRIQTLPKIWCDIYKPVDYGICGSIDEENHSLFRFYSGNNTGENIIHIKEGLGKLCCAVIDLKELSFINFSEIDTLFENQIKNYYYQYNKSTCNMIKIEDEDLTLKCNSAFGDMIERKNDKDHCWDMEDDYIDKSSTLNEEDDEENSFLIYDIEEKYRILQEHIFGQDEQLKKVLSCVIKNINLADSGFDKDMVAKLKSNILLLGKTGVGKTLMIKEIAKLLNVPYVLEDATRYTGSGWAGEDVENMLRNLYVASGNNLTNAEMGILIIDEFDKLCSNSGKSEHSTVTVQQNLLKLIEGTKITISKNNHTKVGGFEFDTSKLTIIFSGAFDGMDKIIEKRTNERKPGFNTNPIEESDKSIQIEDLVEYGMISEFAGRMSNIIELNTPSKEDLKNAFLYSKSSTLNLLEKYLKTNGITIEFDEDFIDAVATKAISLKTGYRGLNQTLNNIVEKELYDIMTEKNKVLSLTSEKVK